MSSAPGGMATVYLAHDERHQRFVALKVVKPDLAAVIGAERFDDRVVAGDERARQEFVHERCGPARR